MEIKPMKYKLELSEEEIQELDNLLEYAMAHLKMDTKEISNQKGIERMTNEQKKQICEHFLDTINKRIAWFEGD